MKKCTAVIIVLVVVAAMSGCSGNGSKVSMVKEGILTSFPSMTVGQAFDSHNEFKSTHWELRKNERGQQWVEFTGTFDIMKVMEVAEWRNSGGGGIAHNAEDINALMTCSLKVQLPINADGETFTVGYMSYMSTTHEGNLLEGNVNDSSDIITRIYENKTLMPEWYCQTP